jgi:hypothetical protein
MPVPTIASERRAALRDSRRRAEALPGRCQPDGPIVWAWGVPVGQASCVDTSISPGGGSGSGPRGNARGPGARPSRPIPHTVQYLWAGWTTWPFGQSPDIGSPHWVQNRWAASTS